MSLADVRDQTVPIRMLQNMLSRNRIPNGLLFWGPSGVGKRLTAFELAKAIHCVERDDDACDACLSCRKTAHGNHPDLSVVAPLKKARIIDVEAVETMNEMASLRPFESKWRVFIIRDADRMRPPAQNHFLKTLEEPPGNSLFILTTENPQFLLPTIRSRCQVVRFGGLRPDTVAELLMRERKISQEEAEAVAAMSQGRMTLAFGLVDSDKRQVVLDIASRLDGGEDPLALAQAFAGHVADYRKSVEMKLKTEREDRIDPKDLSPEDRERIREEDLALVDAESRRGLLEYLYLFEMWYRDKLVYSVAGDASRVMNRDQAAVLEAHPAAGPIEEKLAAIEQSRVYLERFLNEERVFRDLFFVLADQAAP